MSSLFGVEIPTPVNFVIAFVVVLILIGAATWLVRRFGATRLDAAARGRQPRLAVIDAANVDGRRKLVIIRRDNVEHLLMIGGPTDVVVETNIVRAATAATREAPAVRPNGGAEAPRTGPLPDLTAWPLQPEPAPAPAPAHAARPERAPRVAIDDPSRWDQQAEPHAAPPARMPARSSDALTGLASELSRPAEPVGNKPRGIAPEASAAGAVPPPPAADHNLAEMAHRLEAALRRPAPRVAGDGGAPRPATAAPAIAAEAQPAARESKVAMIQSKGSALPKPQDAPQPSADLEQEMANLLGRPGKP
jgi:hypothetical protein